MSRATIKHGILASIFGLVFAGPYYNAQASNGDIFIRAEVGKADTDFDPVSFTGSSDSDRTLALRGGYYFNENFAVETFYSKFYKGRVFEVPFGLFSADAELDSFGIGGVGKKRFGDDRGFFIQGRAGAASVRGKITTVSNPCANPVGCRFVEVDKDSTIEPYFGVGVGYDFTPQLGLSVNYDFQKADLDGIETDTKAWSLGLEVRF